MTLLMCKQIEIYNTTSLEALFQGERDSAFVEFATVLQTQFPSLPKESTKIPMKASKYRVPVRTFSAASRLSKSRNIRKPQQQQSETRIRQRVSVYSPQSLVCVIFL